MGGKERDVKMEKSQSNQKEKSGERKREREFHVRNRTM